MRLDRRLIPEENGAKVEKDLIALIKRAAKGKGISVEIRRIILAEPLKPVAGVEKLVEPLRRHAKRELKVAIPVKGVPLYTDARHYRRRAFRPCSMAPGRAPSWKRMRTPPTSTSSCRT